MNEETSTEDVMEDAFFTSEDVNEKEDGGGFNSTKARKITKGIFGGVAGIGAGMAVSYLAKRYISYDDMAFYRKTLIKIGVAGISTVVVASVSKQMNSDVDEFFDTVDEAMNDYNTAKEATTNE